MHHFTASEQLAIQFVLTYLVNPTGVRDSGWERPIWLHFHWFTEIVPAAMRTIDVVEREETQTEIVERDVIFRLGGDDVAIITMEGERPAVDEQSSALICWAIRRVRYRLRWRTPCDDQRWVDKVLPTERFTGLASFLAPVG